MSIYVTTLPQKQTPVIAVDIYQVIDLLPDTIPYPVNVWVTDNMARFGKVARPLRFLVEQDDEPNAEMKTYFSALMKPTGLQATACNRYKENGLSALRLYNLGKLIIDKKTYAFTEVPCPIKGTPIITTEELLAKLPKTIEWVCDIYLTGGLVKNNWSGNDVDMIVFDKTVPPKTLNEIKKYFTQIIGWKVDVGREVMTARDLPDDPVCLYLLYHNGELCLPPY